MKCVFLLIIISLFFVGCNSDEPKLSSIGSVDSGSSTAPYITNVTVPSFGIYTVGSTLDFFVTFSKNVTVIGTPRLTFVTDTGSVVANYAAGSGTSTLRFSVTLVSDPIDENGIVLSQTINLYGGSIYDVTTDTDAILTFTPPATWGIFINSGSPQLISVVPPADVTYTLGQKLRFRTIFNARVCVTGNPRLTLDVGGSTKFATWDATMPMCATSHYFDYTVLNGDSDLNGVQLTGTSIDLTVIPSVIKNSFNVNANVTYTAATYPNVKVNGVVVAPVEFPKTIPADNTYKIGDVLTFELNYNENVTVAGGSPTVDLNIGGNSRTATYASGSGTTTLTFTYTIVDGDSDTDGIVVTGLSYNNASFRDSDNQNAPVGAWPAMPNVKVDGIRPVISSIGTPANGVYFSPGNVTATVNWSESVIFVGGTPILKMSVDSDATLKSAAASGHTGILTTFSYPIQVGDADFNGLTIPMNALNLPGGVTVTDQAGNIATVLTSAAASTGARIVPDGVQHWYDPSNSFSFGTSAGTSLTQFKDLIGSADWSISDPPKWEGTPKRINFDSGTDYMTLGPLPTLDKLYIVMETKAVTPFQVVMATATPELFINFQFGNVSTFTVCQDCAKYFDGDSWETTADITGNFGTYAANTKYVIMLDYQGLTSVEMILGSGFAGYIHEIFMLSGGANPTTHAAGFLRALQAKHTGAILPP